MKVSQKRKSQLASQQTDSEIYRTTQFRVIICICKGTKKTEKN